MKLVKYFSYLLLAVSAVLIIAFYAMGTPEAMVSTILGWTYVLIGIALVCLVSLPLIYRDGKKMEKSTLLAYGIFVVVVLVAVLFSSNAALDGVNFEKEPSAFDFKFTDGAIMAAGLLIVIAFISIVVGNLKSMFSK
ncbi:MAG: hypothetical protein E7122_01705 [Bacteroidales bacterium]|nr:hypothetical protein [Bacteroidales bacterium]